jgi:polyisoprenoid-binding protein YceI
MKTISSFLSVILFSFIILITGCEKAEHDVKNTYQLTAESVAEWMGAGHEVAHLGSFSVNSQKVQVVNGKIKSGTFTIPIASIQNFDLPAGEVRDMLLNHLKSPDFFNLALYPEAIFTITHVTPYNGKTADAIAGANYTVTGNFTMIGKTNPISFPAKINIANNKLQAEGTFKLDRTKWGMNYAADPALGEHHIFPEVAIHLKLSGTKQ